MINELNNKSIELTQAIKLMGKYGREMAKAEVDYYIAKSNETERLIGEGLAATSINNVIKGHISKELFNYETSKVLYETSKEHINALKKQIEILELQIKLEWNQAGRE